MWLPMSLGSSGRMMQDRSTVLMADGVENLIMTTHLPDLLRLLKTMLPVERQVPHLNMRGDTGTVQPGPWPRPTLCFLSPVLAL